MAVKTLTRRKKIKSTRGLSYGRQLLELIEDQRSLTRRLAKLIEQWEDDDDHHRIEAAEKKNGGKPGISWEEAKKRLGLKFD